MPSAGWVFNPKSNAYPAASSCHKRCGWSAADRLRAMLQSYVTADLRDFAPGWISSRKGSRSGLLQPSPQLNDEPRTCGHGDATITQVTLVGRQAVAATGSLD